ncbi:MAG: AAA family ATPase [Pseudomonadota bacterium]
MQTENDIDPAALADASRARRAIDPGRYFESTEIKSIVNRAVEYAAAGVCVHFKGTAGVGKTSLAMRVAELVGRPVSFMVGNECLTAQDFIGREGGFTTSSLVDQYVHSVRRTEQKTTQDWSTSLLGDAMETGKTLIYDEFTRASPQANATLLSVLEERLLISTHPSNPRAYLRAHPDFRIILTSNPHDYVGVNAAPDALLDRVVTFPIQEPSLATMGGIVSQRTGLDEALAAKIVHLVCQIRDATDAGCMSVLRSALLIARITANSGDRKQIASTRLIDIATTVLTGRGFRTNSKQVSSALLTKTAA